MNESMILPSIVQVTNVMVNVRAERNAAAFGKPQFKDWESWSVFIGGMLL